MFSKNILIFYLLLAIPLGGLILAAKYDYVNSSTFVLLLVIYLFIALLFQGLDYYIARKLGSRISGKILSLSGMTSIGVFFFLINEELLRV